jgi:hypothetical protein
MELRQTVITPNTTQISLAQTPPKTAAMTLLYVGAVLLDKIVNF